MQYIWINKENNKKLIVFFAGWGQRKPIELQHNGYDILMMYDYRNTDSIDIDFSDYKNKYLIAWSMGVYVCNYFFEIFSNFDKYIAINGTQNPINDLYGIPIKIYNLTINNFNTQSCTKFVQKISPVINTNDYLISPINELKDELQAIKNLTLTKMLKFDKAIISMNDKIIPPKNQINWWKKENVPIIKLENTNHYIFNIFNKWKDLI